LNVEINYGADFIAVSVKDFRGLSYSLADVRSIAPTGNSAFVPVKHSSQSQKSKTK
jgi:hypothetical protein